VRRNTPIESIYPVGSHGVDFRLQRLVHVDRGRKLLLTFSRVEYRVQPMISVILGDQARCDTKPDALAVPGETFQRLEVLEFVRDGLTVQGRRKDLPCQRATSLGEIDSPAKPRTTIRAKVPSMFRVQWQVGTVPVSLRKQ